MALRDRVYAVAKVQGRWVVYDASDDEVLFEGTFFAGWAFASDLGMRTAPASVIAVNDAGDLIARAVFSTDADTLPL